METALVIALILLAALKGFDAGRIYQIFEDSKDAGYIRRNATFWQFLNGTAGMDEEENDHQ